MRSNQTRHVSSVLVPAVCIHTTPAGTHTQLAHLVTVAHSLSHSLTAFTPSLSHSLTHSQVYTIYSILFIVFLILIVVTAFITVALTYFQLAVEDHRWWWRSFMCGGSTAFFVLGYCFFYYHFRCADVHVCCTGVGRVAVITAHNPAGCCWC